MKISLRSSRARGSRSAESGHLLIGLTAAVAILVILSTTAMQAWSDVLRRDNEAEMMFRAQEIVRAIKRYQKDKANQPLTELKMLMEPGQKGQYFLRRLYTDPLVRGGRWGLLHAAPGGGVLDPAAAQPSGADLLGGRSKSPPPLTGIGGGGAGGPGEMTGLPIIGVRTLCSDKPFRVFRGQSDYSQWLFTVYDLEQQAPGGSRAPNQPPPQNSGTNRPGGLRQGEDRPRR